MQSMGDAFCVVERRDGSAGGVQCASMRPGSFELRHDELIPARKALSALYRRGAMSRRAEFGAGRQAMHRRSACGRDAGCKAGLQSTHPLSAITAERRVNLPRRRSAGVPKPPPRIHRARAALIHYPDIRPTPEDLRQSIATISYSRRPSPSAAAASMVCMP